MTLKKLKYVTLNINYWDCECKENYIHDKAQAKCLLCGALQEDQPNSRANEVEEFFKQEPPSITKAETPSS